MVTLISQVAVADTVLSMLKPEGKMQVGTSYGDDPFHDLPLTSFLLSSSAHHPAILLAPPPTQLLHPFLNILCWKNLDGTFFSHLHLSQNGFPAQSDVQEEENWQL